MRNDLSTDWGDGSAPTDVRKNSRYAGRPLPKFALVSICDQRTSKVTFRVGAGSNAALWEFDDGARAATERVDSEGAK